MATTDPQAIDLSDEDLGELPQPELKSFKLEGWARTAIAGLLVILLIVTELMILLAVRGSVTVDSLDTVTASLLTPVVGLVGTVLGFCFGSRQAR